MSEITLEAVKLIVMFLALIITRYLIPWLKASVDTNKMSQIVTIVESGVQMAQQVYKNESGQKKKEIVLEYVNKMLKSKGLKISEEELDVLIEAFVKQLKIAEGDV